MPSRRLRDALVAAACLACTLVAGCGPREKLEVLYFYSAICPGCEESRRSLEGVSSIGYYARQYRRPLVRIYDVLRDEAARDALLAAIDAYRVPPEKQGLPLLIVNGTASSGPDEVEAAIAALDRRTR